MVSPVRAAVIAVVAGLFLALAGAFGTGVAPWVPRFAYWISTMLAASVIGVGVFTAFYLQAWAHVRPLVAACLSALTMALPLTVLVWFMSALFFPGQVSMRWQDLPAYFPPVLIVSLVMTAVNWLATDRAARRLQTHAAEAGSAPPKFLERLPLKLRGSELYAVEAEDHYLRLHTSKGADLILMRLADAVGELEGIEGAQVHRSWWVAKGAVTDARRGDGRAVLTLKNGVEAPVSRSFAGALREAGWF
jgi:DNA-binding LytR/AlgR family response regulator